MGLLSMFGSTVTFLTIYTAAPARPTDLECFRHDSKHHPEDLYEHQPEAKVNTSIANEWKLYCEDEWKLELIGSLFFLGGFVGVGLGGFLSDKYGRRFATLALFGG
jgi:MFS family permease